MSYEVEVKYRLVDHDKLKRRLVERGAQEQAALLQEDTYLSHPARDFAVTNEALRLRKTGEENRITYKGPRRRGPTKTREEIEINLANGHDAFGQALRLFQNLGFRPVATIRKRRMPFHLTESQHDLEVTLDQAESLGDFAEIETIADDESDVPRAQAAVLAVAEQLGLTEVEPRSYLRMVIDAGGKAGSGPLPAGRSAGSGAGTACGHPPQTG
jgi:adenylate cyclase, class 2